MDLRVHPLFQHISVGRSTNVLVAVRIIGTVAGEGTPHHHVICSAKIRLIIQSGCHYGV